MIMNQELLRQCFASEFDYVLGKKNHTKLNSQLSILGVVGGHSALVHHLVICNS